MLVPVLGQALRLHIDWLEEAAQTAKRNAEKDRHMRCKYKGHAKSSWVYIGMSLCVMQLIHCGMGVAYCSWYMAGEDDLLPMSLESL